MKKGNKRTMLTAVLILLIIALMAVVGYILLREYQYGVSDEYYDSLRNTGLMTVMKGAWRA